MCSSNHCIHLHENFFDCCKSNSAEFFLRKSPHLQWINQKKTHYNEITTNDHYKNKINICKKTIDQVFYY